VARTKGITYLGVRAFVEEGFGSRAWDDVRFRMRANERELLDSVVAVGWYDLATYAVLLRQVDAVVGSGDRGTMRALGRFQAARDLKVYHRVFLRFANPSYTIEKTSELWRRYHDTGSWRVERLAENHASASLLRHGVVDGTLCAAMSAYMERLLELVGARSLQFEHPKCRAEGEPACVFEARWA
jgi:predicted hydrocarbon binding protein